MITLPKGLCSLSTEVMWIGGEKENQSGEASVRMGQRKALHRVHKDFLEGSQEAEVIDRKARNRL